MPEAISTEKSRLDRTIEALLSFGPALFSLAIIALGIETLVCARDISQPLGPGYNALPVIPWLPAIPWLAYLFGAIWVICGAGLLFERSVRPAAMVLGGLLFVCALIITVPRNAAHFGNISLRTVVFETFALASLAWLLRDRGMLPGLLACGSRYLIALSLIVFGVDHFLALAFIATLLPRWIPWHVFWVAFFGLALIAAGVSIGLAIAPRWGAACIGLMFGIWVVTLHLPRVLGLYAIPGAPRNPNEWSSLFIALAMWGGLWALAGTRTHEA
ncbi:MAG: hypothetical protein JO210_12190 [Acidobacteriaceae bacterium]|nr:hypothetical protein [Acidobacteriaceae bacterium]